MSRAEEIKAVQTGQLKLEQRVKKSLEQIERFKELNAYVQVYGEEALQHARHLDEKIAAGEKVGPLAGMIIAIKDNLHIKGKETTCASGILENFHAPFSATAVQKLQQADAVIIGKTNMDEFAMGSSNENSVFGVVKNPHDAERVPGGSSGGSAVAVAVASADTALGSDTGGSVRQPAAFTGVVGLKPSYGRVSRYGLVAYSSSLDQIGMLSDSVQNAALVLQTIAGHDEHDSTSANVPVPDFATFLNRDVRGLKIGLPKEFFTEGLDAGIREAIYAVAEQLREHGAEVEEMHLPYTEYAIATYYIIATAEASSNLARYDGVRYGFRSAGNFDLKEMYEQTRSIGFGEEVKRRIMLGTYVLSAGYYDAYYNKALKVRRLIKNAFNQAFAQYDLLLTPTAPTTAFKIGEKIDDPLTMYLQDVYTVSANLAGICGISVPIGKHPNGLPLGLQLMADSFKEEKLIQAGDFIEKLSIG